MIGMTRIGLGSYCLPGHCAAVIRLIKLGGRFRLGLEAADFVLSGEMRRENHFQRHRPVQRDLPGLEHDPIPPRAISRSMT